MYALCVLHRCDADGDGNISYPEFVDGLARDLVAPNSIWGACARMVVQKTRTPKPQTPPHSTCCVVHLSPRESAGAANTSKLGRGLAPSPRHDWPFRDPALAVARLPHIYHSPRQTGCASASRGSAR